jgi:hypothetical protein
LDFLPEPRRIFRFRSRVARAFAALPQGNSVERLVLVETLENCHLRTQSLIWKLFLRVAQETNGSEWELHMRLGSWDRLFFSATASCYGRRRISGIAGIRSGQPISCFAIIGSGSLRRLRNLRGRETLAMRRPCLGRERRIAEQGEHFANHSNAAIRL